MLVNTLIQPSFFHDFFLLTRLFSEGGNFHPEELKLFKEDLETIEKNLPGEFQLVEKELKESQNVITNKLHEVFDPVMKM